MKSIYFNKLPHPSEQQQDVINCSKFYNITVKSVAGSGKSTCCAHIIKSEPNKKFLVLTYSSHLKLEMRKLIQKINLNNVDVHSFHSSGHYFISNCINDKKLIEIKQKEKKTNKILDFDYVIIDEVQDMTKNLYEYTLYLLKQIQNNFKIILFGDPRQCIYDYMGSNEKYLLYPEKYFPNNNYEWVRKNLSFSFRITKNISKVLNHGFLDVNVLQSIKKREHKTLFYEYNPWNKTKSNLVCKHILNELENGYKPNDIFILSYSLKIGNKNKSPITIIENILTSKNIPICINKSCNDINDKILISTFHGTKGLERKLVFIIGMDETLIHITGQKFNLCPNIIYVALTRAKEKLFIYKQKNKNHLPFLNQENIIKYCDTNWKPNYNKTEIIQKRNNYFVTDIIKNTLSNNNLLYYKIFKTCNIEIKIPNIEKNMNISQINGIAIPLWIEQKNRGKINYLNHILLHQKIIDGRDTLIDKDENVKNEIKKFYQNPTALRNINNELNNSIELGKVSSIYELLSLSIFIYQIKSGYDFLSKNLIERNWLTMDMLKGSLCNVLHLNLNKNSIFEFPISKSLFIDENEITLNGSIDYIDDEKIIEFKCVNELSYEHISQLYFYMFILENSKLNYFIVNVLTSETYKIPYDYNLARSIVFLHF